MRDLSELNIQSTRAREAPSEAQFAAFEAHFGVTLPSAYREMLAFANGGHPELSGFVPAGAEDPHLRDVDRFYCLNDERGPETAWGATESWRKATGSNIVCIGRGSGGNQIVLNFDVTPPCVDLCLHDEAFAFVRVADSFESFIDLLQIDPEME
jgi:hypothetical protein